MVDLICFSRKTVVLFFLVTFAAVVTGEQSDDIDDSGVYDPAMAAHRRNLPQIMKIYNRDKKQFAADESIMVRPGLLASRKKKTVQIYADSTGLGEGDTIEFYLIGDESAHAYEALAISFAKPGDVRDALIFIGMEPGRGVDYNNLCFWPKGERVEVSVESASTNIVFDPLPLSEFLWDYESQKSVMTGGFVFSGSLFTDENSSNGEKVLAADNFDPFSIISDYNDPATIMDIPLRSVKGDAYGDNTINTKHKLPVGSLLKLTMQPENTNGVKRVLNLQLNINAGTATTSTLADVSFDMADTDAVSTNHYANLTLLLAAISRLVDDNKDPFVTLNFSPELTLSTCNRLAVLFEKIDTDRGIRIEPPLPGQLYHKAFIPDERMRERQNRYIQPLELHLKLFEGKVDATVIKIDEFWGTADEPTLTPRLFPVDLHGGLVGAVRDTKDKHSILLIFADGNIRLGQLLDYIKPLRDSHKFIHIYL